MSFDLGKLFIEWRRIVPNGVPNPGNAYHLVLLKEICLAKGIDRQVVDNVILALEKKEIDPDTKIKYKYKDPEGNETDRETTYKSAINRDKEHPAYKAAKALQDKEDGSEDKGVNTQKVTPQEFDAAEKSVVSNKDNDIPDEDKKGTPIEKSFGGKTKENHKGYVDSARKIAEQQDDDDLKKAINVLSDSWDKFLNAETKEERVDSVRTMIDYGLIERNQWSEKTKGKIYISSNAAGVPYKHFMGGKQGDAVTDEINKIIRENGFEVDMRNNSADRALADLSGKHNEAGVVALLDPSEENQKQYDELRKKYQELGNDDSEAHEQNQKAVELIKESLPEGSKVTKSIQVGGIGGSKLMDLYGIDEKVDPTDMLVVYDDKDGNEQTMKISAKIYSNPNDITMKNSGTKKAGRDYLGEEIGAPIDAKLDELRERNNYQEDGISDQEQAERKRQFRKEYLTMFGEGMEQLTKTEEGEKRLVQMWKDVHGCGHDVHTLIVNKKTGESQLKEPEHYCDPKPPFEVIFDGTKVVINLETQTDEFVQIDCKTEMNSSPKLLFKHKVKKKK